MLSFTHDESVLAELVTHTNAIVLFFKNAVFGRTENVDISSLGLL